MVIGRSPEATYWEFFRADRAQDANAWAAVMSYPHIRVAAPGRVEFFQTAEEYAAAASWSERVATGWVRTEGIKPECFQTSADKLHLAGGWVRYDAADQPILSNRVVYVLTRLDDTWGVQARFACGAAKTWQDNADGESGSAVKRFLQQLNEGDVHGSASALRYPFIVVKQGVVQRFESVTSYIAKLPDLNMTRYENLDVAVVQNGPSGANIAVSMSTNAGPTNQLVFLIDKRDSTHLIASVSIISE